jgi:hypothetical protein
METFEQTLFRSKSENTRKTYLGNLRRLNNKKEIKSVTFLKDTSKIIEQIDAYDNPSTRKSYYTSAVALLEDNKPYKRYYEIYHSKMMELLQQLNDNPHKSEATIEKCAIPMSDLMQRQKELYSKINFKILKKNVTQEVLDDLQKCIIVSLYTLMLPRRNLDYTEMKIGTPNDNEYNYYDKFKFYFNNYKTAGVYGQQIVDVPDELGKLIQLRQRLSPNEWLLLSVRGNQLSTTSMTAYVADAFGMDIGSSAIRNIYLSSKYADTKDNLNKDCADMGTSAGTALKVYIK